MSVHQSLVSNNALYSANTFNQGDLTLVTCMDARIEPAGQLGINLGEAHIIRNAGGSAKEALRSVVISQRLLGTRDIAVFHHTDCGALTTTTEKMRTLIKDACPGNKAVAREVDKMNFLEIPNLEESVKEDVKFLQEHPLVAPETRITGWIYDVRTGKINGIPN